MGFNIFKPSTWGPQTSNIEGKVIRGSRWTINNPSPRRHDLTQNSWGHSCHLDSSKRFEIDDGVDAGIYYPCHGHLSPLVTPGDEVVVPFGRGPALCRFVEVRNCKNPSDQFFATVQALGYLKDMKPRAVTSELADSALIQLEGRTRESHPEQFARGNGA